MLQLKDGVVLAGNKYINAILSAVQTVFDKRMWLTIITSGRDSHETGYHPLDRAVDVRCWHIPEIDRERIVAEIRHFLPNYYDVIYEKEVVKDGKVIKGAHFHIEADAKKEAK